MNRNEDHGSPLNVGAKRRFAAGGLNDRFVYRRALFCVLISRWNIEHPTFKEDVFDINSMITVTSTVALKGAIDWLIPCPRVPDYSM